jgi:hypothetical protein
MLRNSLSALAKNEVDRRGASVEFSRGFQATVCSGGSNVADATWESGRCVGVRINGDMHQG